LIGSVCIHACAASPTARGNTPLPSNGSKTEGRSGSAYLIGLTTGIWIGWSAYRLWAMLRHGRIICACEDKGEFRCDLIENMRDAFEACDMMYWMIRHVAGGDAERIKSAEGGRALTSLFAATAIMPAPRRWTSAMPTASTTCAASPGNDVLHRLVEPIADDVRVCRAEANVAAIRRYTRDTVRRQIVAC
jgi:hypothetical protein